MERLVSSRSRLTPFLVPSLSVPLRPPGRPLADGTVWRRYRGRGVSLGSHACHTLVTHTACLIRALCHSSRPSLGARLRRYGECDESVVRDAVVKGRVRGGIRLETERDVERRDRRRPPPFPLHTAPYHLTTFCPPLGSSLTTHRRRRRSAGRT